MNILELWDIRLTLQHWTSWEHGHSNQVHLDKSTTMVHIDYQGRTRSLAAQIKDQILNLHFTFHFTSAMHIPGMEMYQVDSLRTHSHWRWCLLPSEKWSTVDPSSNGQITVAGRPGSSGRRCYIHKKFNGEQLPFFFFYWLEMEKSTL